MYTPRPHRVLNPVGSRQASTVARPLWNPPVPPSPLSPTATSSGANRPSLSDLPSPAWSAPAPPIATQKSRVTVPLPGPSIPKPDVSQQRSKPARAVEKQRNRDRQREEAREADYDRAARLRAEAREADYDLAARLQAEEQDAFISAQRQQAQLDAEDARLRAERDMLAETMAQTTFDCAVCMESWAEDSIARVDGCDHALCRPCMKQYIQSALRDRSFPIVCPICKADKRKEGEDYTISPHVVETIGLDESEFAIWNGLQIVGFSVEVECRKCNHKVPVDREDYEMSPWIKCPMPGCKYIWCKKCNQEIPLGPVDHSCDGTKELDRLMKQAGWKYCPGCNTPCEKIEGCNHMTCKSPGCNTHFCYRCGELIVKSATNAVISAQMGLHYARCSLFDNIPA
ncbi:hypothetical protein AURDEDRAFT_60852 [Auricularia subglabra TFB-10046 SS5]|nr:hypothetical protein AURDEDRAFT_60852 [Auricularia subglabra TFB-10046 SS5]